MIFGGKNLKDKNYCDETVYCQTCNISSTFVGNEVVYHSDAVGAEPVGAAPTTSSFLT